MNGSQSEEPLCWAVWSTAWGLMGAVAEEGCLLRIVLPHYQLDQLKDLLAWEYPGARQDRQPFKRLIQLSREYFNGKSVDFGGLPCRLPKESSFAGKVLRLCRAIPYGRTRSYGMLGARIGRPAAARAVATVLGKNRLPLVIPCHRVIYADGRPGGFSAPGGPALKQKLLDLERRGRER